MNWWLQETHIRMDDKKKDLTDPERPWKELLLTTRDP